MVLSKERRATLENHSDEAQEQLLAWFARHARDLPWRRDRNPYRVWVSEVMLQQTQVETVRDYYIRFMARFPDVETLAAAPLEDVLKLWEGLGYYSRARSLHRAAQMLISEHDGMLPANVEALRSLPGIGPYTAGAIASIAFGIPAAAIDGNVRRVMARVLTLSTPTRAELEDAVCALMPQNKAGPFTEALMELGATLCRPKTPRCLLCPWRTWCGARQLGEQEAFPAAKPRKTIPHYDVVAAVTLREDRHVLVAQRRYDDMLGGLWEFPGGKCQEDEPLKVALRRELQEEMGIEIEVGDHLITVKHAYTHFRITLSAFECRLVAGEPQCFECEAFQWATAAELRALPMAVTDRKIATVVEKLLS